MMAARLLALDWGSSSLRAYLLDGRGDVLEQREWPWGILQLPEGGFEAALRRIAGSWMRPGLPIVACGMVGSAQGWHETPYVRCPAGVETLARALLDFQAAGGEQVHIVAGLLRDGERPDVMRGEETQVVGALSDSLPEPATLILPGTHSKWVRVHERRIVDFQTYMTGELFAVLREHSILGRPAAASAAASSAEAAAEAFARGVRAVREHAQCSITQLLFLARTLVLTKRLPAADSLEFLSGLLIGEELRAALSRRPAGDTLALVGDSALCGRYQRALTAWGLPEVMLVRNAAARGLWLIALQAGLLTGD